MRTRLCLLGSFAFVALAMAAPRTWHLQTAATITGDYVSSGTVTLVIKVAGTNCFLNISDLSAKDQAYVAKIKATAPKPAAPVSAFEGEHDYRLVNGQSVDLGPIHDWEKNHRGERPMPHWKDVQVTNILSGNATHGLAGLSFLHRSRLRWVLTIGCAVHCSTVS